MRYSSETLEIFSRGKRVASHKRDDRARFIALRSNICPKDIENIYIGRLLA